ncbi:MAG: restriction endonuclease [SAR324 cluster bacterium]|nr:restriction endonuclease [SAR324 cluster bacterium]
MTIPKHYELRKHILDFLKNAEDMRARDFESPLAELFNISEEERNQMYESGNGPVFADRVSWALSYLSMAGLVDKPKRGVYRINEKGLELLASPDKIDSYIQQRLSEREENKSKEKVIQSAATTDSNLTPQERLYESYEEIRQSAYEDILDTIMSKSPTEFEHLVVRLLERMGYGGQLKEAGEVTQASNDQGIDGVIKEDILGLGKIHIQAKRYNKDNTVGREEIQKFVGALAVAQSNKGVFISTSFYSKGAIDYAKSLNTTTLVLIDGLQLAKYIYDFSLGMQVEQTIEIKKMDSDFWDAMQDA